MVWLLLFLNPALSIAGSSASDKELPQFGMKHFSKQTGLTSATILSTEQSQLGYLWIGTYDGLNRFNGVDFRAFTNKSHPQLPSNAITALLETSDGALWIGTLGYGVVAFEDPNLEHEIAGSRLPGLYVNQLLETEEGAVLVATRSGVFRYDQGKWHAEPIRSSGSTQSQHARSLALGSDGSLYVAWEDRIEWWNDGHCEDLTVRFPSGIAADCIAWHPSSGLWVGTYESGLFQWHEGMLKEYGREEGWLSPAVADLAFDSEGGLWAGGRDGVARIRADGLSWLNLAGQMAFCLEPDLMGGMWVGTYHHGIYQLGNSVFSSYSPRHRGEVAILGRSVVEWQDQVLIGTNRGFYEIRGGYLVPSGFLRDWESVLIRQALVSKDGGLWVATHTHGLGRVDADGSYRWFGLAEGLGSLTIRAVLEDRKGRVWIGSAVGLYVLENGRISKMESMGAPVVLTIHELRDGTLFVGLDGEGFALISDEGVRKVSTDDGLPSGIVFSVWEDEHGVLWLTCNGGGIVRYTQDEIRWFYRAHGLPDHSLFYLIPDDQGYLWMGSQNGVYRISRRQLEQAALGDPSPIRVSLYDAAEGFSPDGITSVTQPYRDGLGRLWFPTLNGVSMVDPVQVKPTSSPPWAVIEWIKADDSYHYPEESRMVPLGPGVRRLTFQFVGFGSDAPEKQEYQVKLEGYDHDWFRLGNSREHAYTNLQPGNYHFRVQVANRDGIVSEHGADVWVALKARYYQTNVFRIGVASLTVALLVGVFLLRIRYLRNDRHRLAGLVEQRTKEWEEAASNARHANESKSRFLAMVSHEVRTPMNGIIGLTDLLMDTPLDEQQRTYMELVQSSSLSLLQLLNDLLDWSKIESGKLSIEQIPFDLQVLVKDCERLLKPQFDQKGLTLSTNIAPEIPQVLLGDPLRVRQILLNLLSNAMKFTNSGGVGVSVRLETREADTCKLHFEVSDTGIGLSGDAIRRLFVDYSQADASISRTHGGTGLGLSICKTLVELMGGRIWVVSEPGEGAAFHFLATFPCAKDASTGLAIAD